MLLPEDRESFLQNLSGVSLSSDAFFPFRDSIDHASRSGVSYIAQVYSLHIVVFQVLNQYSNQQAGGSVADDEVVSACDEYGMTMAFTDLRLFHH